MIACPHKVLHFVLSFSVVRIFAVFKGRINRNLACFRFLLFYSIWFALLWICVIIIIYLFYFWQPVYGPKAWGNVANSCRQSDQSPIDIVTDDVEADSSLGELDITCDNEKGLFNGILLNNGHEAVLTADGARGICNLTGASLKNKYFQLHDLNIHFGCDTDRGSEHTIDGKPFPAEVRLGCVDDSFTFQRSVILRFSQ